MQYKNCPIVETILDISFDILPEIESLTNSFGELPEIKTGFPRVDKQLNIRGELKILGENIVDSHNFKKTEVLATLFTNADKTQQIRLKKDGFSFHQLGTYPGYKTFTTSAFAAFSMYFSLISEFNPFLEINRIAIRTVNRIMLTLPFGDFDDYITIMPKIPDTLPDMLSSMFSKIRVPVVDEGIEVVLTQTFATPIPGAINMAFILDIDVLLPFAIPELYNEEDLMSQFERIHKIKNEVFESCITDATRELFNQ